MERNTRTNEPKKERDNGFGVNIAKEKISPEWTPSPSGDAQVLVGSTTWN